MLHGAGFFRTGRFVSEPDDYGKGRIRFVRLLGYLKPYKFVLVYTLLISICATILNLAPPRIIGMIIDRALVKRDVFKLLMLCCILLAAYIVVNFWVINAGRIIETGTHSELLAKNGFYTRLHEIQFKKSTASV
ncbi:MAG: hypothetical protein NC830_04730 [Candidatus Omnitrophica bacterium]|nr:hypothetical protein [Candidatus Omnitrophota bacterium]